MAKEAKVADSLDPVNGGQLRAFVERIERLEEEKKALADDIKDVYAEAKGNGFDVKVIRKVVSIRKQDRDKRLEEETILDLYLAALGHRLTREHFATIEQEVNAMPVHDANAAGDRLGGEAGRIAEAFAASVARRSSFDAPYRHYLLESLFPADVADALANLPFAAPDLGGVSGRRELHNDSRSYFDAAAMARFPVMRAVAEALQSPQIIRLIADSFAAPIDDTFLRLEYAQDVDGFWLEPHTDLGVKKFTCLIYLSDGPGHDKLGTDIYWSKERHFGVSPFKRGAAMVFVPADDTWHGFEKRGIAGVRRSVILNYVTHDWRAREQLSFPENPVRL